MNKSELIDAIAAKCELSKKETGNVINALTETIADALSSGEKVAIMGFGSFEVKERAARTGRNPQTGKTIEIKAKKVPKFNPGSDLKEKVARS